MKLKEIVSIYRILKEASLNGLASDVKMSVIKNMLAFKKYVNEYDSDVQLAKEKTITKEAMDAFNEIERLKVNGAIPWATMSDEEKARFMKNSQIVSKAESECGALISELDERGIEGLTVIKIGEDSISKIIDTNDINVDKAMTLVEILS